jgi:hypothetical protein
MKRLACAFAVAFLPWSVTQAAECNRLEYSESQNWYAPCKALGIELLSSSSDCTDDRLATAKAELDWVVSNAAALKAYRASLMEQTTCGFPPVVTTQQRALIVAVKAHNPMAQCVIVACQLKINLLLQDLDEQGKLP